MLDRSMVGIGRIRPVATAIFVLTSVAACASRTALPLSVRSAMENRYEGHVVELRRSCYYGELYDDNDKWLLTPYPFKHVYHIVDFDGEPIHPEGQRGIVPAGTPFIVDQIEFPDAGGLARRMLTTPRYNPWIYLRRVVGSPLPMDRRDWILLLPRGMKDKETLERELDSVIAPEGRMIEWLASRRPVIRVAIEHKEIIAGMNTDEMIAAMGRPLLWFDDIADGKPVRVAWYDFEEAWMIDDHVTEVRDGREAEAPPAP